MAIPTFSGNDRTKCLDWISRVRNVCKQSGRNFRQELVNKSELLVQNFITSLHNELTEAELIEKILRFFSDVPTTAHALEKLKQIQQGIDEPIVSYNQRYKNLVERVEGKPLEEITSIAAMEMYLGSINIHIRKAIRTTLFWNSKHAPRTVQEAMTKAQEIYIKHLYSTGEDRMDSQEPSSTPIVIEETNTPGWPHKKQSEGIEHLIHSPKRTVTTHGRVTGMEKKGDLAEVEQRVSNIRYIPRKQEHHKDGQRQRRLQRHYQRAYVVPTHRY